LIINKQLDLLSDDVLDKICTHLIFRQNADLLQEEEQTVDIHSPKSGSENLSWMIVETRMLEQYHEQQLLLLRLWSLGYEDDDEDEDNLVISPYGLGKVTSQILLF
jgi:hypothetical protein